MIIQKITFLSLAAFSSSLLVPLPAISKSVLSKSISEIIGNYYSKYTRNVDIIDFGGNQGDLVNEILLNLQNSTTVTLIKTQNAENFTRKIEKQSILLFNNITDFLSFERNNFSYVRNTEGFEILVYCQNATAKDLSIFSQDTVLKPFFYFITLDENDNELKLWTFENRMYYSQPEYCSNNFDFVQVNKFLSINMTWIEKPVFRRKFRNFYNCSMLYVFENSERLPNFCLHFNLLMDGVEENLNFKTVSVRPVDIRKEPSLKAYNFLRIKLLHEFEIDKDLIQRKIHMTSRCNVQLLVPSSDDYSLFEKISIAFGTESWIAIFAAFSSILLILILLRLKAKSLHSKFQRFDTLRVVFGYKITKMSYLSLLGLVFMIFVFCFMIIRTAYHGKMFEFSIIEQMPKSITLDELKARNIKIYMPEHFVQVPTLEYIEKKLGLSIEIVPKNEFQNIYTERFNDPSFAGAIFRFDLSELRLFFSIADPLKKPILFNAPKAEYVLHIQNPFYWADRYQEIQDIFTTSGLDQNFNVQLIQGKKLLDILENDSWQLEEHVLRLDQIGWKFFVLFLGLYLACFLILLMEVLVYRREGIKMMIFDEMDESDYSCIVKLAGWLQKRKKKPTKNRIQRLSDRDTNSVEVPSIVIDDYDEDISES